MATIPHIRNRLLQEFPEPQADLLARVFVESHDELVTKAELNELTGVVKELAEAQRQTAGELAELAEAQKRTDWAVADLAKQVGGLSNALGGSLEDFACDLVPEILEKHWTMQISSAGPEEVVVFGRHREFDVVVRGTIAGKPVTVLCETKASVSPVEVQRFLRVVEKAKAAHPEDDIRPLFFGYKADRKARELIVKAGAAMVFTRGVMIPKADDAA
ncbi:MAG: hypothetical protein O3A37_06015 [Planctomycetota bacterium]|jgi:hypothetical protein|nr:hypothetical protein [Planctomycetota bacterium]